MASWIIGIICALVSLAGLAFSSQAVDKTASWAGILFFLFGVLFCYKLIIDGTAYKK